MIFFFGEMFSYFKFDYQSLSYKASRQKQSSPAPGFESQLCKMYYFLPKIGDRTEQDIEAYKSEYRLADSKKANNF